jgi:hypothetical protein
LSARCSERRACDTALLTMPTTRHRPSPTAVLADSGAGERWCIEAGSADVAVLAIPASADRHRVFEIDVRFIVSAAEHAIGAWHALSVDLNGLREWSRRSDTHSPGQSDSLDYHCRRELGVGESLRVRATTQVHAARRLQLVIEAEEATSR